MSATDTDDEPRSGSARTCLLHMPGQNEWAGAHRSEKGVVVEEDVSGVSCARARALSLSRSYTQTHTPEEDGTG